MSLFPERCEFQAGRLLSPSLAKESIFIVSEGAE